MSTLPEDTEDIRKSVIDACLRMRGEGLVVGTAGNVSVRVASGLLVTPSGIDYDAMRPEMLQVIPETGEPDMSGGMRPTSEWRFHQAVHAARPDLTAVVHAHPPFCTALAIQRRALPACHYMIAAFGGSDVPLVDYALFGSVALARGVAAAMRERSACLLANHGAIAAGETLEKALWRMSELELLARMFHLAEASGTPVILSEADIEETLVAFANYGPRPVEAG